MVLGVTAFKFKSISHGASFTDPASLRAWVYIAAVAAAVSLLALCLLLTRSALLGTGKRLMPIRVVSWIFILALTALLGPLRHTAASEFGSQFPAVAAWQGQTPNTLSPSH